MTFAPAGAYRSHTFTISSHDVERVSYSLGTSNVGASVAYPAANLAIFVPFVLEHPATAFETWVETGAVTTSNVTEIGVYTTAFVRLFTTATTVATASDTVNSVGMTDYVLDRGSYYLAFGCDGTRNYAASALAPGIYQSAGLMEQTGLTGAALPATATPVAYTRTFLHLFGLNLHGTAL